MYNFTHTDMRRELLLPDAIRRPIPEHDMVECSPFEFKLILFITAVACISLPMSCLLVVMVAIWLDNVKL
jgi:hypothetical protein